MKDLHLIVAIGEDGSIGKGGDLIWKISEDLKRFKTLTTGHPVIMGRKTWESLPKKPLPGRRNIIVSRKKDLRAEGAEVVNSIEEALQAIEDETSFVIGGSEIYKSFLPKATVLDLTHIRASCGDADAFLQLDLSNDWEVTEESELKKTPDGVSYQFVTYRKKKPLT